jgi:hypothetical protein
LCGTHRNAREGHRQRQPNGTPVGFKEASVTPGKNKDAKSHNHAGERMNWNEPGRSIITDFSDLVPCVIHDEEALYANPALNPTKPRHPAW